MTTDERLRFIELRKREIDLARAMVESRDDLEIWKAWYSTAMQVEAVCEQWDPAEQAVLNDLSRMLRVVYSGAFGVEHLLHGPTSDDEAGLSPSQLSRTWRDERALGTR